MPKPSFNRDYYRDREKKKTRMVIIVVWLAHNEKIINKLQLFLGIFKEINEIERKKKFFKFYH